MGTIVIDERIYPIRSLALGEGAILTVVSMSAADAALIPTRFDWSLHAPDGSFVCRGRFAEIPWWPPKLGDDDVVELTLHLDIKNKVALPTKVSA